VFAQAPNFSAEHGNGNRDLLLSALGSEDIEVLGTTPYIEDSDEIIRKNIECGHEHCHRPGETS